MSSANPSDSFKIVIDKPAFINKGLGDLMFIGLNGLEPLLFVVDEETPQALIATAISEVPVAYTGLRQEQAEKQKKSMEELERLAAEAEQMVQRLANTSAGLNNSMTELERLLASLSKLQNGKKH
jgi:hypothetical protein